MKRRDRRKKHAKLVSSTKGFHFFLYLEKFIFWLVGVFNVKKEKMEKKEKKQSDMGSQKVLKECD